MNGPLTLTRPKHMAALPVVLDATKAEPPEALVRMPVPDPRPVASTLSQ
jgi:hypothetical protein